MHNENLSYRRMIENIQKNNQSKSNDMLFSFRKKSTFFHYQIVKMNLLGDSLGDIFFKETVPTSPLNISSTIFDTPNRQFTSNKKLTSAVNDNPFALNHLNFGKNSTGINSSFKWQSQQMGKQKNQHQKDKFIQSTPIQDPCKAPINRTTLKIGTNIPLRK